MFSLSQYTCSTCIINSTNVKIPWFSQKSINEESGTLSTPYVNSCNFEKLSFGINACVCKMPPLGFFACFANLILFSLFRKCLFKYRTISDYMKGIFIDCFFMCLVGEKRRKKKEKRWERRYLVSPAEKWNVIKNCQHNLWHIQFNHYIHSKKF